MASLKQIRANRKNYKKSTGPITDSGKAKVSINAFKHGLYAEHHIAVGEDTIHFKAYVDMMLKDFNIFDAVSGLMVKKDLNCGMGFVNPLVTIHKNELGHSQSWRFKKQKKYNYYD